MRRIAAWLMSATLALTPVLRAAPPAWLAGGLPAAATALVLAGDAEARAGRGGSSRSSGGYSRPSPRTPSFSTRPAPSRTPSPSGGYARPSAPSGSSFRSAPTSSGDQAISRERAAQGLQQQRAQQDAARQRAQQQAAPPRPAQQGPSQQGSSSWWGGGGGTTRTPSTARQAPAPSWFGPQRWTATPYAAAAPRSFGVWDGLFLWFMLDNLTRPGTAGFFRSHADDPGVQAWRQQADALAQDNADLRRKLAELDAQAATSTADTGWVDVPPGVPRDVAMASGERERTPEAEGGGWFGTLFAIVLLGGSAWLAYRALRRRRAATGGDAMNPLQSALSMARNAVAPKPYRPDLFRVGMVLTTDLSPFILAAGATRVTPPAASPEGRMTVAALGTARAGTTSLVRLHLDDRKSLFQLHLDPQGRPDEVRYFSLFDEVAPADAQEWGAWLDPAEGMIGWPEFQTQDGKLYARAWSPGSGRIAPVAFEETIESAEGSETIRLQSMLYAAPTGLAAPAPETEYILVSAVERAGQAWVELRAGIDINPASLELS